MNRAETLALFAQGKDAWNAWANEMLAKRKALEAAGDWKVDYWGQPDSAAAKAWAEIAGVEFSTEREPHTFEGAVDFRGWIFPWTAGFTSATFKREAEFSSATFKGDAGFSSATFKWTAWFDCAKFEREAGFSSATFEGRAGFTSATFEGYPRFTSATIKGEAGFNSATFKLEAGFESMTFEGDAGFESATFKGEAGFSGATFKGFSRFSSATFEGIAGFSSATFNGTARFSSATFEGDAWFDSATFTGDTWFSSATFKGITWFDSATFKGDAWFSSATFVGIARFSSATFEGIAGYGQATYDGYASYENATFIGPAEFVAIRSERAFSLAGAEFHRVPNFIQAHFSEAPRLDDAHFRPGFVAPGSFWGPVKSRVKRLFGGDPDVPARWRALKRLAIQGHDHEREQAFFPMEIRSARFLTDWPLPLQPYFNRHRRAKFGAWLAIDPEKRVSTWLWKKLFTFLATSVPLVFWRGAAWLGFFRFWFGIVYQILSNFGRSVFRPALFFLALVAVSAVVYLQESDGINGAAPKPFADLARAVVTSPVTSAAGLSAAHPCFTGDGQSLGGLSPVEAARTDKISEALHLAFANGSIVGSLGTSESARRTYGCLYGFVRDQGGASHLVVPPGVTLWATLQKTLSVILIFLFGLAVRNMLKVR